MSVDTINSEVGVRAADTAAPDPTATRAKLMAACADATLQELAAAVGEFGATAETFDVRAPETGLVMLRGRIGGDGAAFNVGEATVTRAVVELRCGQRGYAYLLGRSGERARLAATLDALGQTGDTARGTIARVLVAPVAERLARETAARQTETAATRVDFFTLVRGDD